MEDFFTHEQLQPCCNDIEVMVDNLAKKLYAAGKIQGIILLLVKFLFIIQDIYTVEQYVI